MYNDLLDKLRKKDLTIEERIKAVKDEYDHADLGDCYIQEELVDLIHMFDDEVAVTAAEIFEDCYNFYDLESMERIEMLQRVAVAHKSYEVREVILECLEINFKFGIDDETCWYMKEDGIMDTSKFLGLPEEYEDHETPREIRRKIKKYDLFISYASEQRDSIVKPFIKQLREAGVSVWVDFYGGIFAGNGLRQELLAALDHSRCFCIIVSKEYLFKRWTIRELNEIIWMYMHHDHPLVPLIHGISTADFKDIQEELIKCDKIWLNTDNPDFESPSEFQYRLIKSEFEIIKKLPYYEINNNNSENIAKSIKQYLNSIPSFNNTIDSEDEEEVLHAKPNTKHDLFLSYSISQQAYITEISNSLSYRNISIWNSDVKIDINDHKRIDIFKLSDHANCFCVFLSKEYLNNKFLRYELNEMRRFSQYVNFPILPICVDISLKELLTFITNNHFFYEDFEPWLNNIMCIESKNSTPEEIAIEIEIFIKNSYSRYCLIPNRLTN